MFFYVYAYKIPIFRDTIWRHNPQKRERTIIVPSLKCYDFNRLSCVVFPLGVTHIAALEEFLVHSQRATQYVRCVRRLCHSDILV